MHLSLLTFVTLTLSLLPSSTTAQTKRNLSKPGTNTILAPSKGQLLPAGSAFTITWSSSPSTTSSSEKIDILLLSTSAKTASPILTIAKGISNTGSFIWDVPKTLEPGKDNYRVELVVEGSGLYNIGAQIGIANEDYHVRPDGESSSTWRFETTTATATGRVVSWSGSASGSAVASSSAVKVSSSIASASTSRRPSTSGTASGSATTAAITGAATVNGAEGKMVIGAAGLMAALVL